MIYAHIYRTIELTKYYVYIYIYLCACDFFAQTLCLAVARNG